MYVEMVNDKYTKMQLKFQDLPIPSVFITTHNVDCTGLILTAANYVLKTQKFYVLNEQCPVFTCVVQLWYNSVPLTKPLNTGCSDYDNRVSDLHWLCGVAQMGVLNGLIS